MKKILAAILAAATVFIQIPIAVSAATTNLIMGDVNCDQTIDVNDVTDLQKYLASVITLNDDQLKCAKVCGESTVSVDDVTTIQKYLVGRIDSFPGTIDTNDTLKVDYSVFENREHTDDENLYMELFDSDSTVSVEINMSDNELQKMQNDYVKYDDMGSKSPIYRKADSVVFTVNGKKYEVDEVGVRMKGNTSRTDFFSDGQMTNLIHLKLDFQETFDDEAYYGSDAKVWGSSADRKARKNRTFATLEKMDLKWNKTYDSTYVRQNYDYDMFRDYGQLASHSALAKTTIGDTYAGIYTLYEPVDKVFLEKYLPESEQGGDLYKSGWTNNGASFTTDCSIGAEDEDNGLFYNYDIKTNKKTTKHEALNNLISTLNSSSLDNEKFESVVDKDYFVTFAALSYFSGNPDDLRNCYNNYYVYFRPNGKAVFIPYDTDRCLGITYEADPTGNGMTKVDPYSNNAVLVGQTQKNPIYKYAITSTGAYKSEYTQKLKDILATKWLTYSNYEPYYNSAYEKYSSDTTPASYLQNADSSQLKMATSNVNMSVEYFMNTISTYCKNVLNNGGETPSTSTLTIKAQLPANTPMNDTIYLASNINGWKPSDSSYTLTRTSQTTAEITIDATSMLGKTFEFKLTRGSWSNCECKSDGTKKENNMVSIINAKDEFSFTVGGWADLVA